MNWKLPDVQAGFRKGRGTRDQIAKIHWIIEKQRSQKNIYFCFIVYAKAFDCVDHNKLENSSRDGNTRPPYLPPEKFVCRSRSNCQNRTWNNRLVSNWERSTSRLYIVTLLFNLYAEYIVWNAGLDEAQLESRLLGEISITLDMQMTNPYVESKEKLKSILMKVKEECEKVGLKLNI